MKKKIIAKKFIMFIMALSMILCFKFSVSAESPKGSVEVYCHGVTSDGERVELGNSEFVLYRVGEYISGTWNLTDEFAPSGADLGDMTASYQREAAKILYSYALENNFKNTSAITDSNGKTVFSQLDLGLYLIAMKEDYAYGNGVFCSDPFLVTMPITDNSGSIIFDFTVEPKAEWTEEQKPTDTTEPTTEPVTEKPSSDKPTVPTSSPSTTEPGSQQTGQDSFAANIGVSLIFISLFIIFLLKRRKSDN